MKKTSSKCDQLAQEATDASIHSTKIAANLFEEASKCYDEEGNRTRAGQYLTLAGDFFLDLGRKEKSAACYGKAIIRYLMIDDIDTVQLLLEKGKEYGFSSKNPNYRIALDTLERKAKLELEIDKLSEDKKAENYIEKQIEPTKPSIEIELLEADEENQNLIEIEINSFNSNEDVIALKKDFIVPQYEDAEKSDLDSLTLLTKVSNSTKDKQKKIIETNVFSKDLIGNSIFIEPKFTLDNIENRNDQTYESKKEPFVTYYEKEETELEREINLSKKELDYSNFLKKADTLELDYLAKAEIINEYEEELIDIEVVNTIPFQWQVIDVRTDFSLQEKRSTTDGLVFTWRKEKIDPGKKLKVEYILRKRVERSIILRKENKLSIINFYNSIKQDLNAHLNFVNTSSEILTEILIEDLIPPELVVENINCTGNKNPQTIPTHDSTLYRWIINNFFPGDNFLVDYCFREKPLTRYYQDEFETEIGTLKIDKISQPFIDSARQEYIWMYTIENPLAEEFVIYDRIPSDYEIILVDPIHMRPSVANEKSYRLLSWKITPEQKFQVIIIRICGNDSFTPLAPQTLMNGNIKFVERKSSTDNQLIDLRRLKNKLVEKF